MQPVNAAQGHMVVSGQPFDETLEFFTETLGFRLDKIMPADDPAVAEVSCAGLRLRIDNSISPTPLTLRITGDELRFYHAPNGMTIEQAPETDLDVPDLEAELVISLANDDANWVVGRAGMRYRDLIPSRLGGKYIASHIEVCDGGPVPDMVHHHGIRFQMIFCHQGWVDVVYEDQGEPFRLEAGDCVLQPPHIRHKVLASSAGAQVVEIGCPAAHETLFDHDMTLPTGLIDPGRDFGGQRFVRHEASEVAWTASSHVGFEEQTTAIEAATNGLASVRVLRADKQGGTIPTKHDKDFWFMFVLDGSVNFSLDGSSSEAALAVGDSVTIPAGMTWCLRDPSPDLSLLEVIVHSA